MGDMAESGHRPFGPGSVPSEGMSDDEIELLQDLTILRVEELDGQLVVDVYGGVDDACGSVRYSYEDPKKLARHARTLNRWRESNTLVTYVRRGDSVALVDDRALLQDALA